MPTSRETTAPKKENKNAEHRTARHLHPHPRAVCKLVDSLEQGDLGASINVYYCGTLRAPVEISVFHGTLRALSGDDGRDLACSSTGLCVRSLYPV